MNNMELEDKIAETIHKTLSLDSSPVNKEDYKDAKKILSEIFKGIYVECPDCKGKGEISYYDKDDPNPKHRDCLKLCSNCKGTGKVQAIPDVKEIRKNLFYELGQLQIPFEEAETIISRILTTKQGKLYL